MDETTLQQLHIFRVVAEEGSFSAAARRLDRAQSAVSYAIASLEGALGLTLFQREGHKPELTVEGRALLEDARAVGVQMERLLGRALALRQRVEAELVIVLDVMFPLEPLIGALGAVQRAHPEISVRIRSETLGAVAEVVRAGDAQIGICPAIDGMGGEFDVWSVDPVDLIAVVAPGHPLAGGSARVERLAQHVQIVLSTRPPQGVGPDRGVLSPRTWRIADLSTRHALVLEGFGWANMPRHVVAEDLASGRLVPLLIPGHDSGRTLPMVALARRASPPGPAGRCLIEALARAHAASDPRAMPCST